MSRFSIIKKIKNVGFLRIVIAYLIYLSVRVIFFTYRLKVENTNRENKSIALKKGIFYFWHQNIIAAIFFFFKKGETGHCIVSPSKDGKIMGFVAEKFGFSVLYGSSKKRSFGLLKNSLSILKNYQRLALVGDGSRGPIFELQKGIIFLAAKSDLPLIFLECKISKAYVFKKSWDKFKFPLPFSKISVKVHSPVFITEEDYKNF